MPPNAATTNHSCLVHYKQDGTIRTLPVFGVMDGCIKVVCSVGGIFLCLARMNSTADGRLALISLSQTGERHRIWNPNIDNLVSIVVTDDGAGFALVDHHGTWWGVE